VFLCPIRPNGTSSRNLPQGLETILDNCLAHGRRKFVDVAERFPEECRHVLESLSVVYRNDAITQERKLSPLERLLLYRADSSPVMTVVSLKKSEAKTRTRRGFTAISRW
jgi:hypothetical protein